MKEILVADDTEYKVKELIETLKKEYKVYYVFDGKQAVEFLKEKTLDAAILDVDMPPLGTKGTEESKQYYGNEVAKTARKLQPNLVLILRSTSAPKFKNELEPFDVYCHDQFMGTEEDDKPVIEYLHKKIGV